MKAQLLFILISFFIFNTNNTYASHYMGGEITWECIPAGQPNAGKFIFTLKVYRECGGITFGNSQTLNSTSPAGNIPMTLVTGWPKDISPDCAVGTFPGGAGLEITCIGAESSGADNTGAVSEYIYKSAAVQINGVPSASGWIFSWGSCCRNPSTNINGQPGWKLRAKMYPYNNQNTYPCFDNSPVFAETANSVLSAGYPFQYNHNAFDKDLDRLQFEWGEPLITLGNPVTYTPGYSYTNPLPSTTQDTNNVAATIDPNTGTISFTSYTTGAFVTSVKVSSYKSNILVAEIWRDIQVVMLTAGANTPPNVVPPFNNGTSYNDTITEGDTVSFTLNGQDIEFFPNGVAQSIEIEVSGVQFGTYIPATANSLATFDTTSGCLNPPCASLTPAPDASAPLTAVFGIQTDFYWQTSSNHLMVDSNGYKDTTNYSFIIHISDDYCPAPASSNTVINITILPIIIPFFDKPEIKSINVSPNGDVSLYWDALNDTANVFDSYYIYCADSINGPFTLIDSILNPNINTYTHNANLDIDKNKYYYLSLNQSFQGTLYTKSSSIITNIALKNSVSELCISNLQWNAFSENSNEKYYILKKEENTSWLLIDTTYLLNYTDTFTTGIAQYRVELESVQITDSLGNNTISITQSGEVSQSHSISIGPDSTICEDESFIIIPTGSNYISYEWNNGSNLNYLSVNGSDYGVGTHYISVIASTEIGCNSEDTMMLIVEDCTSLSEIDNIDFSIFPNPNSGKFTIKFNNPSIHNAEIDIVDVNGKTIYKNKLNTSDNLEIDISENAKGTYFIRINDGNKSIQKVITLVK